MNFVRLLDLAVCILVMQRPGVTHNALYPPTSVANIFGHWLDGITNKFKTLIRVGAYALIWSLCLCRNDLVFNDKNASSLQVIFRCTHSLRMWCTLQRAK